MTYQETYQKWLNHSALSADERAELQSIERDLKEQESRFFAPLEFGTAGLRGTMCVGLHQMNVHVIRHATQAFAEVILAEGGTAPEQGVAICHDCRNNSRVFAEASASVMAGNGIKVRIFEDMRPTPEVSYAVREYGCIAGINVTASHNPKEYNGFKVYWADGAQLPPHHADAIAKKMDALDVFDSIKTTDYTSAVASGMITVMGAETDEKFLNHVMGQISDPTVVPAVADTFKMVYTPFHGTGYQMIPKVLKDLGMKHVLCVPEQMVIDGDFPTVASPNPENAESFALAVELTDREGADFILGSDPDADRVGILARNKAGKIEAITGNQTGVLILDYLITARQRTGKLPANPVALKTIVTTEMARKVAETNGVTCYDTFTGFKFMAEKKNELESKGTGHVFFSYEESYGYMIGDFVRDKDAVTAALVCTEMAAYYASKGMTLFDALDALYEKYGHYNELTLNLVMPGLDGLVKMKELMANLRANPLTEIAGMPVVERKDYADGSHQFLTTGKSETMELIGSNVLRYKLEDGTDIIVRPSGTEPKVKVYILAQGANQPQCKEKLALFATWAESLKK